MQFAELAVTTNFTFLTGASHPEEMVMHAAELGLDAIAITDRNTLAGVVRAHVRLKELKREQVTLKPRNITGSDVREHAAKVSAIRSQVRIDPSSRQPDVAPAASADQARGKVFPHRSGGGAEAAREDEPEYRSIPKLIIGARLVLSDTPVELIALVTDRTAYGRLCRLLTIGKRRTVKGECDLHLADVAKWAEGLILIAVLPDVLKHDVNLSEPDIQEPVETWQRNSKHSLGSDRPRVEAKRPPGGAVERCPATPDKIVAETGRVIDKLGAHVNHLALTPRYDGLDGTRFARLTEIAEAYGLAPIATAQPVMHRANRRKLADILTCIREGCTVDTLGRSALPNAEQHLRGPGGMARIWHDYPDALKAAAEIASLCNFSLDELRYEYPDEGNGETPQDRLARLAAEGLRWRYPEGVPERAQSLVNRELDLIGKLNYAPYFLTVHDIVAFARSRGILCQGRGSAANSTVCYALGVTEIAPDTISMVFERFVSEAREEPPDIDVDFEHERREEVIQHIYETYGRERAGLTATVIHFRSRAAIREVGKAMGLSEDVTSALSGQVWGWSQEAIREERLREVGLDPTDRRLQQALALVEQIIGFPRHLSQHVGGFVITAGRLDELCPIENAAMDDRTVIEWDKDDIDALGILKVDVLALGMLTCIRKAFDLIAGHLGTRYTLATLPPECPEVYDMLCEADSLGVFQVESRAQMNFLPRMRPRNFYDLVIEVAIIRPGPIQGDMVHPYIRRRQGEEPVSFPSEELGEVLGKTLGVPLFQEQAMRIAIVAAGFIPDEADRLRRSLATFRKTGTISSFRERFIGGMLERGYEPDFADRCFSQIEGFGEYGFPESHAASFALLVYASAWLKRHHPAVFACALLNAQPMGFYAPAQIVRDAREHGVIVCPVCINASFWDNTLEADGQGGLALRLGFRQIKGLKEEDGHWIAAARGNGYPDIESLWRRAGIGRRAIEKLAEADAFAESGLARRVALWDARGVSGDAPMPLFGEGGEGLEETVPDLPEPSLGEDVVEDYRALRLSLRAHPLAILRPEL